MENFSILRETTRRDQGDYSLSDIIELVNFLDQVGYSPIKSKGYTEQKYYEKTVVRGTSNHGKARLNFVKKDNKKIGLALFVSRDCQFPTVLYMGLAKGSDIIPMLPITYVKHLDNQVNSLDYNKLADSLVNSVSELNEILVSWSKTEVNSDTCINIYNAVNNSRPSDFAYICPRLAPNLLELFRFLTSDFLYGTGIKVNGKNSRAISDLRKHRNHVELFMNLLSK